jgi:hypothetical protein
MPVIAKKSGGPLVRLRSKSGKKSPVKLKSARTHQSKGLADISKRKKIGKSLDMVAFAVRHKQNTTTSAAHWETKE